jgi:LuxR family maltose regulon positive regulatory protein
LVEEGRAFQAELDLRQGRITEALAWARNHPSDRSLLSPYFYIPQLTLAKVHLARDTTESREQASAVLGWLHDTLGASNDQRRLADVLAVEALLCDAQQEESAALDKLNQALALTESGGAIRPFADLGAPMESLLRQLPAAAARREHVERILGAFAGSAHPAATAGLSDGAGAFVEPLTNREQDVLELLAQRLRDKEIADQLVVSTETVKSHLKGLYQKLGAGNRREAVAKARELGILSSR